VSPSGIRHCTDDDERRAAASTPVPILHVPRAMDDKRSTVDKLGGLEGADAAALGTGAPPEPAPPGAEVADEEQLVPGANMDTVARDQAKPWFSSLAAGSDQAGVANDPPDAQEPQFPTDAEDPR
jgi:hypothetical protein